MAQNVIALISDCDGTICPDTASLLVSELGLSPAEFWLEVSADVENGWDPPLAWLNRLIDKSRSGSVPPLTSDLIRQVGEKVDLFPGVSDFLTRIREHIDDRAEFRDAGVTVEWYIVSSGLEELVKSTSVAGLATAIFGSRLKYDEVGRAVAVRASVTFTEKTKFIFAVNKGISSEEIQRAPYRVNDSILDSERRVPFSRMVYLGDGPTDIPCFSMVKTQGGQVFGVIPPDDSDLRKPYELASGDRLTVGPYTADYRGGSDLFKMLLGAVDKIGDKIVGERAHQLRTGPRH